MEPIQACCYKGFLTMSCWQAATKELQIVILHQPASLSEPTHYAVEFYYGAA